MEAGWILAASNLNIFFRVFREKFMGDKAAVRFFGDYIGKGTAAINPYLPLCHCKSLKYVVQRLENTSLFQINEQNRHV